MTKNGNIPSDGLRMQFFYNNGTGTAIFLTACNYFSLFSAVIYPLAVGNSHCLPLDVVNPSSGYYMFYASPANVAQLSPLLALVLLALAFAF